jgi:hypothetical protein
MTGPPWLVRKKASQTGKRYSIAEAWLYYVYVALTHQIIPNVFNHGLCYMFILFRGCLPRPTAAFGARLCQSFLRLRSAR